MNQKDRDAMLRIVDIGLEALAEIRNVVAGVPTDETPAQPNVVPISTHDRAALYRAIAEAGPDGITYSAMKAAALDAGYKSLRGTQVYYRVTGRSPHLRRLPNGRRALTEAGQKWLADHTAA